VKLSRVLRVIGLISCSMLVYEILLTRISALRLFFHFGFLVISNCLLGIGASGTFIFLFRDTFARDSERWIWRSAVLYLLALIGTYAFLLTYPISAELKLLRIGDLVQFTIFNLVAALPFFFAGGVIGLILTFHADEVNKVYFADLLGAGLGCFFSPFLLARFGAGGTFVFLSLLAVTGVVHAAPARHRKVTTGAGVLLLAIGLWILPTLDQRFPVPGKGILDLTQYRRAEISQHIEYSCWSATSRIDVVKMPPSSRMIFARGRNALDIPLPDEKLILQDGSAGTFILDFSDHPQALDAIRYSLYSAAMQIKDRPRVYIIGAGGGNDLWAALIHNASSIKGIELNQPIIDIHYDLLPNFSRDLIDDPRVEFIGAEGRNALMRDKGTYDIIQMSGIDTWTSLTSGAYVLAENYLYTREAIRTMYDRLAPGGILEITRFAADMEALRLLSNVNAAFEAMGVGDFERSVICLRTVDNLVAILVKKGKYSERELNEMSNFTNRAGIEVVYLPGLRNRNLWSRFIRSRDKASFIRDFPRNISPTTDDEPYFFNFTKWSHPIRAGRFVEEPTHVSQGNPLFIIGQLVVSTVIALLFILAPLALFRRRGLDHAYLERFLVYFSGLGAGFISIEIALMQKLTLFLGHPLYSITVTLFAILVFTGFGSLFSGRWFHSPGRRAWFVPAALAALLTLVILFSPAIVTHFVGLPLPWRITIAVALLAPIALVLGIPFAYGIHLLNRFNPTIVPWAWAVNGFFTVIGSILVVIVSMNLGFSIVLVAAVLIYAAAFASLRGLPA